jgi:hypothetical protein
MASGSSRLGSFPDFETILNNIGTVFGGDRFAALPIRDDW